MAASMCDVFSFCMGVAGRARVSVEVRFVSSSKVRPEKTPTPSGLGNSPVGPWRLAAGGVGVGALGLSPRTGFGAVTRCAGASAPPCAPPSAEPGRLRQAGPGGGGRSRGSRPRTGIGGPGPRAPWAGMCEPRGRG